MAEIYDLIVLGAGPAGMAACIYGARNGLDLICLEKGIAGGQAAEAPLVENYPGFSAIKGAKLMEQMQQHAQRYVAIKEGEEVKGLKKDKSGKIRVRTDDKEYVAKSVMFCTGSTHRKLGVKGEDTFFGRGVSYCATCDGFFFKGRDVLVAGGGNTAVMGAILLSDLGCKVRLIHRRDQLRAEDALQKQMFEKGVMVIWNSKVAEIKGDEKVQSVITKDTMTNKTSEIRTDGVFVQIGELPNSDLASKAGIDLTEGGFIPTDREHRTSISGFYAAGDVTGGIKQIVVACSQGATAALTAYKDLAKPYWA